MKEKEVKSLTKEEIKKALLKRAIGYDAKEVIEEYVGGDDGVKLTKKKITYKNVPPDVTALKILIDDQPSVTVENMTDEELIAEKERLLQELNKQENENKEKKIAKKKSVKSKKDGQRKVRRRIS